MKNIKELRLSEKFLSEYRMNLLLRILGSLIIIGAAAYLTAVTDFSAIRYPFGAKVLIYAVAVLAACFLMKIHLILFCKTKIGVITDIRVENRKVIRSAKKSYAVIRPYVVIEIEEENGKKFKYDMHREDSYGNNLFITSAAYKIDDKIVHLRGLKYPMRYGIKDANTLFDPNLVCPYCGEINKYENRRCNKCRRHLER